MKKLRELVVLVILFIISFLAGAWISGAVR